VAVCYNTAQTAKSFSSGEVTVRTIWADAAPPIAGLTFLSDQEAATFFTSGKMPDGKLAHGCLATVFLRTTPKVAAYLKSLSAAPK